MLRPKAVEERGVDRLDGEFWVPSHGGSPQTPLWGGLPKPPLEMRFDASPDPSPERVDRLLRYFIPLENLP
jgi:hypothetical protein